MIDSSNPIRRCSEMWCSRLAEDGDHLCAVCRDAEARLTPAQNEQAATAVEVVECCPERNNVCGFFHVNVNGERWPEPKGLRGRSDAEAWAARLRQLLRNGSSEQPWSEEHGAGLPSLARWREARRGVWQCGACGVHNFSRDLSTACDGCGEVGDKAKSHGLDEQGKDPSR